LVDHITFPLEQNLQASIAKARRSWAIAFISWRRAASSARVFFITVMRQQPIALHASRSLVPNAARRWAKAFRFLSRNGFDDYRRANHHSGELLLGLVARSFFCRMDEFRPPKSTYPAELSRRAERLQSF
jgi:hypothetical protein